MMVTRTLKVKRYNIYKEEGTGAKKEIKPSGMTDFTLDTPDKLIGKYGPGHIFSLESTQDITYGVPIEKFLEVAEVLKINGEKLNKEEAKNK